MENIKARAWEYLLELGIGSFSPHLLEQKNITQNYKILSYQEGKDIITSLHLESYIKSHKGFSMYYHNSRIIFYDESLPYSLKNYVLVHEIAHFYLGHLSHQNIMGKSSDRQTEILQEKEADIFALAFLAPAPVLRAMDAYTPEQVARVTGLPLELAQKAAAETIKETAIKQSSIQANLIALFGTSIEKYKIVKPVSASSGIRKKKFTFPFPIPNSKTPLFLLVLLVLLFFIIIGTRQPTYPVQDFYKTIETEKTIPKAEDGFVYATKSGEKYHLLECQYVRNKQYLKKLTLEQAQSIGLEPCSVCTSGDLKQTN